MSMLRQIAALLLIAVGCSCSAYADDARFDLPGPTVDILVTRGMRTLPIAQVPSLLSGDQLRIKADLPPTQSNHLLLIVAFLRGTTNEPPDSWFTEIATWKPDGQNARRITVPVGAQRVLLFFAPETGGDFDTLRSVVKRNPGLFLRASDSLFKASLEEQRIERYLTGMQSVADATDKVVAARSAKLASALVLKPNATCFKQPIEDQVDCLTKATAPMLLDSAATQSISTALSTGASSDFINEASQNDGGVYSAYVGTLVDLVHLIGSMHTAQYRYIPALTLPSGPSIYTRLNAPPSFDNPKSVIVIALPPIRPSRVPDLRLDNESRVFCLRDDALTLPLRGSAILYSTTFAHDLFLDFGNSVPNPIVPLSSDVLAGGLRFTGRAPVLLSHPPGGATQIQATLHGTWGFDTFLGPTFRFQQAEGSGWKLIGAEDLVAGHKANVQLQGNETACLEDIALTQPGKPVVMVPFTFTTAPIALTLPLDGEGPGTYILEVRQHGVATPATLPVRVYRDAEANLTKALLSADRRTITLVGAGAKSVEQVRVGNAVFTLLRDPSDNDGIVFHLLGSSLPDDINRASVYTKDGRTIQIMLSAEDASMMLHLLRIKPETQTIPGEVPVDLLAGNTIPLHSILHFVVSTEGTFSLSDQLEIEVAGEGKSTQLSFGQSDDQLILADAHTAVGTLGVDKAFGASAFGSLRLRAVRNKVERGPWMPLGKLVRRPHVSSLRCVKGTCNLRGSELFLVEELSFSEDFLNPVVIPATLTDDELSFPSTTPHFHAIYLRLRDDPDAVAVVTIPRR